MNRIIKSTILFLVVISLFSCKNDDDTASAYIIPLSEQAPVDDAAIIEFLTNNYFNEEEFITPPTDFNFDIKFYGNETITGVDENGDGDILDTNEIAGGHTRKPLSYYIDVDPLLPQNNGITIETETINVRGVDHTLYILKVIQGQGVGQPKFCDEALLSYEGITLDKNVFDNAHSFDPSNFDLTAVIKGFSESASKFNVASGANDNGDGTITYQNYGVGAAFMPSGLGYYSDFRTNIPVYSPLIFKLKVYGATELDHDNDGVPTYVEDLNGDHDLENDDTDSDGIFNFRDVNDENDPVLTREEVTNTYVIYDNGVDVDPVLLPGEEEIDRAIDYTEVPNKITITRRIYKDTDGDGIFDYLDTDS